MRKDKEKVVDEVWTEDRVRQFLKVQPPTGANGDFHMLEKAYQSMRSDDFELFVGMFLEAGHDINAQNQSGRSVLSYVKEHRNSAEFATVLNRNGAQ
ncbi:MAG: hypothetical protein ACI89D_001831 [Bermanella sp.]|jgi:hypothetical protein